MQALVVVAQEAAEHTRGLHERVVAAVGGGVGGGEASERGHEQLVHRHVRIGVERERAQEVEGRAERRAAGATFAISSLVTPFFMGCVVGAIAAGNVPAGGNGDPFSTWLAPLPLFIGAMFVRSITIYLVRTGTLSEYEYLEHGAHWAIGALAVILLVSVDHHLQLPEVVTGLVGVVFIGAALASSVYRNRHTREREGDAGRPGVSASR